MFLKTVPIKTNKNHMIPFLEKVKNSLQKSHGKNFCNLHCFHYKSVLGYSTYDYWLQFRS